MPRMRIALLTHSINPRGGVVHVLELARALQDRGHAVTVLAPAAPGQKFFRRPACRIELAALPSSVPTTLVESVRDRIDAMYDHLTTLLERESFDVFHAHDGIGANALADLVESGRVTSYLRTVHHVERFADPQLQDWEERSIRAASQVLCVSSTWCEQLKARYAISPVQVSNGVDLDRFTPAARSGDATAVARLGVGAGWPVILAVGGIEARKNTVRLLQAFGRVRTRFPRAQLVIAGGASLLDHSGEARRFAQVAADLRFPILKGEAVVVTGPLADDELGALYRTADVIAMPSLLEGFGLAAIEGLASGAAAVVSRIAPFTEHFDESDVSWADPMDDASIADAVIRAITRGRHDVIPAVCRRFTWSASARRHEVLYRAGVPA